MQQINSQCALLENLFFPRRSFLLCPEEPETWPFHWIITFSLFRTYTGGDRKLSRTRGFWVVCRTSRRFFIRHIDFPLFRNIPSQAHGLLIFLSEYSRWGYSIPFPVHWKTNFQSLLPFLFRPSPLFVPQGAHCTARPLAPRERNPFAYKRKEQIMSGVELKKIKFTANN